MRLDCFHRMGGQGPTRVFLVGLCAALVASGAIVFPAGAQTWDGEASTDRWTDKDNWDPDRTPAIDGTADVTFSGSVRLNPDLNKDWKVHSVTFDEEAGAFVLGGVRTLSVTDGGILNRDRDLQTFSVRIRMTEDQTWDAAAGPLRLTETILNTGHDLTVTGAFDTAIDGSLRGGGGLTKSGAGTVTLSGDNTFSGDLVIDAGTLLLGGDDRINNSVDATLGGGTFATGGFDERLKTLTLSASSVIDLGDGDSVLEFAKSDAASWTDGTQLTIFNWTGSTSGGGTDQLYFGANAGGLSSSQLRQIQFADPFGPGSGLFGARILETGEVVPIPEPATVAVAGLIGCLLCFSERRRLLASARRLSRFPRTGS